MPDQFAPLKLWTRGEAEAPLDDVRKDVEKLLMEYEYHVNLAEFAANESAKHERQRDHYRLKLEYIVSMAGINFSDEQIKTVREKSLDDFIVAFTAGKHQLARIAQAALDTGKDVS